MKQRRGPTTPQRMLPLKWTRAMGQVKPFMASGVQRRGIDLNIQFKVAIWTREERRVEDSWSLKSNLGGIFM